MISKEKPYVKKGGRGTPFTVNEARLVAEEHHMDEYHREIICWLIYEVERLEKENKGLEEDLEIANHEVNNHG